MKWFNNIKFKAKMLISFALVLTLTVILGVTSYYAVHTLTKMTEELSSLEKTNTSISKVLNAHYIWRQGITETGLSGKEFSGSLDPDACALGKWKDSEEAKSITDPQVRALIEQIDEPHRFIHTEAKKVIQSVQEGDIKTATEHLNVILPKTQEVISGLMAIVDQYADLNEKKNDEVVKLGNVLTIISVSITFVAILIAICIALFIANLIGRSLNPITMFFKNAGATGDITISPENKRIMGEISQYKDELGSLTYGAESFIMLVTDAARKLEAIADGDLTAEFVPLSDKDTLGNSLKKVLDNLNGTFGDINTSTTRVLNGAKQVAVGSKSLAQGSTEQTAAIEELSKSVSEITERIKESSDVAGKTAELTSSIQGKAEKGSLQMDKLMEAVQDINEASYSINKIIKTIDDIAFQTNILALNAAVEAARAGEHGKGFAVVAEEVRNLAAKSAEAAKDTGVIIQNSIEKAEYGSNIAGETAASLTEIVSAIRESSDMVSEIANTAEGQSMSIIQINNGIDQVALVVKQNSTTAQESAGASQEMSAQSDLLQQLIAHFRLREMQQYRNA
ncbi:MAG: methyl-accepting chemotaxis protein [Peptococcaceae bacterium]|jgi:methyl-accepting chemotaxis protein|nr:methyl-accepting chemotaxis protein [Peptococcaceae bacterium]